MSIPDVEIYDDEDDLEAMKYSAAIDKCMQFDDENKWIAPHHSQIPKQDSWCLECRGPYH